MGEQVQDPSDYLMSDWLLCDLVNNLTPLDPARGASSDEQPILTGFMPGDSMDWSSIYEKAQQEVSSPPEAPPDKQQGSGTQGLLTLE